MTPNIHPHLETHADEMLQTGFAVKTGSPGGHDFVRVVEPGVVVSESSDGDCYVVLRHGG